MTKETQGEVLKRYLLSEMMTQKELSLRIDVSQKHISNMVRGKVKISEAISLKLRFVFGTEEFYFSRLPFNND